MNIIALLALAIFCAVDTVDVATGRRVEALAQVAGTPVGPPAAVQPQRTMADYASVLERGLFGDGAGPASGSGAVSPSTYRLIGTIQSERFAGAVLDDGAGMQGFYLLYQKLPDASQIVSVRRDRVSIKGPDGVVRELQVVDDTTIVDTPKPTAQGVPLSRSAEPPRPAIQPVPQGAPLERAVVKPQLYSEQVPASQGDAPGIDPVTQEAPPAASLPGTVRDSRKPRHQRDPSED